MEMTTQPPTWDLESEYPSVSSDVFSVDLKAVEGATSRIRELTESVRDSLGRDAWPPAQRFALLQALAQIQQLSEDTVPLLENLLAYVRCQLAVNADNAPMDQAHSLLQDRATELEKALQPARLFISRAPEEFYAELVKQPAVAPAKFIWDMARRTGQRLLSEEEESLVAGLRTSGHVAWGELYTKMTSALKCDLVFDDGRRETVGVAQALALTKTPDENQRKAAWTGLQAAWTANKVPAAAVLNALAGWRLEMAKRRSHRVPVDFLTEPLHMARTERRTLDAMMEAVAEGRDVARAGLRSMARLHGKDKLDPWDLLAPAPLKDARMRPFDEGFGLIHRAFSSVSAELGEFAQLNLKKNWIDGRILPSKSGGAFCSPFPKSRTSRVFQTYMGSASDVSTLAHELGHAYHSWVMRDLPWSQFDYPMTLAETASLFCETVLGDFLAAESADPEARLATAFGDAERAAAFLLNIPARYDFERSFYERRKDGVVSADELSELTDRAWTKWYGDSLSKNDRMFWATKLHFSIADVSFYNFPYTFGYLFALAIYGRRDEMGAGFMPFYTGILRDTGRMTVEEVISKHFGEDAGTVGFWRRSVKVATDKVEAFRRQAEEFPR